jgi:potassium-dependent mechanosensitive channel
MSRIPMKSRYPRESAQHLRHPARQTGLVCSVVLLVWSGSLLMAHGQGQLLRVATGATSSQPTNPAASATTLSDLVETLKTRLVEARADLAAANAASSGTFTNVPVGVLTLDLPLRQRLLERLVRVYEQQLSSVAELENTKKRLRDLTREAQAWSGFAEARPYSVLLPDGLREEIQAEQLKVSNTTSTLEALDQIIQENRTTLRQVEENIRHLNEQLETAQEPSAVSRLTWQRDLQALRSQATAASLGALDLERQLQQERSAESRIRLPWLQRKLLMAQAGARFTQADLDTVLTRLESERRQLESELAEVHTRHQATLRALDDAREELRRNQDQPGTSPTATARAKALVELRGTELETTDAAVKLLRLMLEAGNTERSMWEMRYAVYDSHSAKALSESASRLAEVGRRIALWTDFENQQLAVSSSQIALQQARLADLDPESDLAPLARARLTAFQERDRWMLRYFRTVERLQRLAQRWQETLEVAEGRLPFTGRLKNLFSNAQSFLGKLWRFELFTAVDTITVDGQPITGKRSVTVSKVIIAALILIGGIWLINLASRFLEPIIVRRLKLEPNQASLIRRWLTALMVTCLVAFSLLSVKIPLTVFAFAGGALAIGIGFGTQTLLKNFISGIIILFERPFRVGDVLDVAGQRGTITIIGLRASVLQLWDGTETLIPNSTLLENTLTNWTYSNRIVRFTVTVGVAYGSEIRRVIELLGEVADQHGLIEKTPKHQVLFTDFAESALTFELRFWLDVSRTNSAQVSSDLRQMIAGRFAEHGIVIAFPQRDLHLDSTTPFPVRVVSSPDGGSATRPDPNRPRSTPP